MYTLKFNPRISTKHADHYNFMNENCCTVISSRSDVAIELVVYNDRKEFVIYQIYGADTPIMDNIFNCIYDNLEFLGAKDYDVYENTNGNSEYIKFLQRKYGVNNEDD